MSGPFDLVDGRQSESALRGRGLTVSIEQCHIVAGAVGAAGLLGTKAPNWAAGLMKSQSKPSGARWADWEVKGDCSG